MVACRIAENMTEVFANVFMVKRVFSCLTCSPVSYDATQLLVLTLVHGRTPPVLQ